MHDVDVLNVVRLTVRCWRICVPVTDEWRAFLLTSTRAKRRWRIPCTRTPCARSEHSTCAFSETVTWLPSSGVSAQWMWHRQAARRRHCRMPQQNGALELTTTAGVSAMTEPTALCCPPVFSTTPANWLTPSSHHRDDQPTSLAGNLQTTGKYYKLSQMNGVLTPDVWKVCLSIGKFCMQVNRHKCNYCAQLSLPSPFPLQLSFVNLQRLSDCRGIICVPVVNIDVFKRYSGR